MLTDFMIGPSILMYHSVDDQSDDEYSVSGGTFKDQMRWLSENGFEVISLEHLIHSINENKHKQLRKKIVITFDDGYQDFLNNALPVLQDFKAPATVFIVTEMLGEKAKWNETATNTQLMTDDEIRYIKAQGISLGSHTCNHARLTTLNNDDMLCQIRDSRERLASLGETFYALSYPWGQYSTEIANAVKYSGYACALAVGEKTRITKNDIYHLPRVTIKQDAEINYFGILLKRRSLVKELRRRYGLFLKWKESTKVIVTRYKGNNI